jgi:colanic acid/amylovoran biosynthesis glycosyltransferase
MGVRIAYVVNQYPRTSHSFIRREIEALERKGLEVLRFSLRPLREPLASDADRKEVARTRVVLDAGVAGHALALAAVAVRRPAALARAMGIAVALGWRSDRGVLRHLVYLAEACVLARWLRAADVDHLHAHFGTNSAAVALLCHAVGGPKFSFTVHGPEEFDRPELLRLREKVRRAGFVVAISNFARSQLFRWTRHEDWHKVHVVRCGLGADLLRAALSPVPADPRLVCVARISEQKGHLLLVEAAARLAAEGLRFEIVLAGDGPLRGTVEDVVRRSGLERHVRFAGWIGSDEVREAIVSSRALVLPSFAEGLPVVITEALALGRPVITTAIAGIPEIVQPGVTGWVVPAGDVDALARAMRAALEASTDELGEMGRAGAAFVARHHDAGRETEILARLFRGAAGDEPPSAREDGAACPEGPRRKQTVG